MNSYLYLIYGLLIGTYILDTVSDLLNLNRLKDDLPEEFQGLLNSEKYKTTLRYQAEGTYFELIHRTVSLGVLILFIESGGFNRVDQFSRSFNLSTIPTGLLFIFSVSALKFFLQLPFSIYHTFVFEEKYGFNKTSLKTFFMDIIKSSILGAALGSMVLAGIIYFFEQSGPNAWIYCWVGLTLFQILLTYLAPAIIMPLFNKFEPLPPGELRNAIETYANIRKFQLNGIFTMDSSRRSTKSNAFFTGFGRFRKLVLFDTLIEKQSTQELVAILAHEIGHFELKHMIKSMVLSMIVTGITFYTFSWFLNSPDLFAVFGMNYTSVYASLVFIGFIYSPILRVFSIFTQKLSRKHEYEADRFAKETNGNPELLISALKKLSIDHLSHLTPHPLKVTLDYSHPPILERIRAIRSQG